MARPPPARRGGADECWWAQEARPPPCGQGQGVGDECAEECAAHGQASICVSGCIELLLYALALSGAILLRLRF